MNRVETQVIRSSAGLLSTHRVLRNTYALLAMTLLFSAACAGAAMMLNLPYPGVLITLVGYFGLFYLVNRFSDRAMGLLFLFLLTGFMGATLGPILNAYLGHYANGGELVAMALGGTGLTFLGLSAYALVSQKDFSFLGGMLGAGILVAFLAGLVAVFMPQMIGLSMAVSVGFHPFCCGWVKLAYWPIRPTHCLGLTGHHRAGRVLSYKMSYDPSLHATP